MTARPVPSPWPLRPLVLAATLAAGPAAAATVAVQSGEHESFSRLVLMLPAPANWQLFRTADGYVFDAGLEGLRFDLDEVFTYIPRDRLGAVWAEPGANALNLRVVCACHALPFELRPGLVVIDIRDGPAPPGAAFELDAAGRPQPPLAELPPRRPRGRPAGLAPDADEPEPPVAMSEGLDWMALAGFPAARTAAPEATEAAVAADDPRLDEMRRAILGELARGAAQGTVDLALPEEGEAGPGNLPPNLALTGNGLPDGLPVDPAALDRGEGKLTPDGRACLPDAALDLPDWGDSRPVAEAIGPMTGALTGEFDRPQPEAAARAVRYLLHLGFGAEARHLAASFAPEAAERPLWDALARVLDGDTVAAPAPFAGMEGCDSNAALWAILAGGGDAGATLAEGAIRRAFAALPPHLRRQVGPALVDRLLDHGAASAAEAVATAMARGPATGGAEATLVEARIGMADGHSPDPAALAPLRPSAGLAGLEATLAAVDAHLLRDERVPEGLAGDLAARAVEFRGTGQDAAIAARLVLARASRGDFEGAFALAGPAAAGDAALWDLLARKGDDGALLRHAVLDADATLPEAAPETRARIAERLRALGLAGPAQSWEAPAGPAPAPADHADETAEEAGHLDAHAAAAVADGALVERGAGPDSAAVAVAPAETEGGVEAAAVDQADTQGTDAPLRVALASRDWAAVAAAGDARWSAAAARAAGAPSSADQDGVGEGPLAQATALVAEAAATRADIDALLAATAIPVAP